VCVYLSAELSNTVVMADIVNKSNIEEIGCNYVHWADVVYDLVW
jgi:hypothetical protein